MKKSVYSDILKDFTTNRNVSEDEPMHDLFVAFKTSAARRQSHVGVQEEIEVNEVKKKEKKISTVVSREGSTYASAAAMPSLSSTLRQVFNKNAKE